MDVESTAIMARVPFERLPDTTALFRGFAAAGDSPIRRFAGGFAVGDPAWAEPRRDAGAVDARLLRRLGEYNRGLGVSPACLERLERLHDGSARAIVTGQQPGVLGGPLMTLYKIAAAAALAEAVEERWAVPCVPIYWMASDDDDFAEIRELVVLDGDSAPVAASLDASAYRPGMRVGDIGIDAVKEAWRAVAAFLPASTEGRGLAEDVSRALGGAGDLAEAAARTIVSLTEGAVAVVDGREPELRECARDLILDFFDAEPAVRDVLESAGRELEALGYHGQLSIGRDSGVFYLEDGRRHKVPPARRAWARTEWATDITRATPGVVLRNLVQDALIRPLAAVLGPAEIAYRAQMHALYARFHIPRPVAFPRLAATYVPSGVRAAAGDGADWGLLATDPHAFVRAARASTPSDTLARAARVAEDAFRRDTSAFVKQVAAGLDGRAREKLEKRLADLERRLSNVLAAAVSQASAGRPSAFANAAQAFRRDGAPQERFLSLLVPFALEYQRTARTIEDIARTHVRDALDGRVMHVVYSP